MVNKHSGRTTKTPRARRRLSPERREAIGARIKRLRQERGWTQRELAERSGIDPATMNQIETGVRAPDVVTIDSLADSLGVPPSALLDSAAPAERSSGPHGTLETPDLQAPQIQLAIERGLENLLAGFIAALGDVYAAHLRGEGRRPPTDATGTGGAYRTGR